MLCLAAAPAAAQLPNLSNYHVGALHLDLSSQNSSQIEIDEGHLGVVLCGDAGESGTEQRSTKPDGDYNPPGETCRLVISNDGSHGGVQPPGGPSQLEMTTALSSARPCGVGLILVRPNLLRIRGVDPIQLSCGKWTFAGTLTALLPAPSQLNLLPAPVGMPTGQFSGVLGFRLDLTFDRLTGDGPLTYSETRTFDLDVAGRWTVIQSSNPASWMLPAGETNLALFVDRKSAGGLWSKREGCGTVHDECTKICLTASSQTVNVLNGVTLTPPF
jgi:hypothetical protein